MGQRGKLFTREVVCEDYAGDILFDDVVVDSAAYLYLSNPALVVEVDWASSAVGSQMDGE